MAINTNQKQNILSVNGKVGEVKLSASDVGALPIDTKIPTKTSELENDSLVAKEEGKSLIADSEIERLAAVTNYDDAALSGRVTNIENEIPSLATQSYVTEAIANADHLSREIVEEVPSAETAKENVIYMYKVEDATGNDKYREYLLINGEVTCIGDTSVDLTDYATNVAVAEVEAKIPTKITPVAGRGISVSGTTTQDGIEKEISISNYIEDAISYPLAKFSDSGEYFAQNNSDAPIGATYPLFLKSMKDQHGNYIYQDLHDVEGKHWYRFFKSNAWTDWVDITIPADAKFTDSGAKIEDYEISTETTWSSSFITGRYEDAKDKAHEHTNKEVIDKFSESDDGSVLYNGNKISSNNITIIDTSTDIDFNDYKSNGSYTPNISFSTGEFTHSILNAPTTGWLPAGGFLLEVKNFSSNWNTQVLYSYINSDNNSAPIYTRTFFYDNQGKSVFTNWKRMADIDDSITSQGETWSSKKINDNLFDNKRVVLKLLRGTGASAQSAQLNSGYGAYLYWSSTAGQNKYSVGMILYVNTSWLVVPIKETDGGTSITFSIDGDILTMVRSDNSYYPTAGAVIAMSGLI